MSLPQLSVLPKRSPLARDIDSFIVDRQARGFSPRTIEFYELEMTSCLAFFSGLDVSDVPDIKADHLRRYLLDLGERRNAGGVHCAFRAIRTFLYWWETEYEPEGWSNPIRKVRPPKLSSDPLPAIPLDVIRSLLGTCKGKALADVRDRAMILCLLDTGARASEFCGLNIGDVNIRNGTVLIRHGKGNKGRSVFLGARSRRELARYLRLRNPGSDADPLWAGVNGGRLNRHGLTSMLRRRAKKAGVDAPSPHDFRRTFAITSLRNGCDLHSLRRLMGHAGLDVLKRYLDLVEADLRAAHERSGPVDSLL